VVGALFTLLLPLLLLVRPRRSLVLTVIGIHLGILTWYVIKHQDRYLQALMPWIAAATAAFLVLGWRQGRVARVTLTALVGLQIVWGADVYFIRSHDMIGDSVLKRTIDFIASGHEGKYRERFRFPGTLEDVGKHLSPGAKLMLHEVQEKLGLGAPAIVDMAGWQGAFEYLIQDVPSDVERLWRDFGATHVLWLQRYGPGWSSGMLAREAVFFRTVEPFADSQINVGDYRLLTFPPRGTVVIDSSPTRIAWLGCAGDPASGLYTPTGLEVRVPLAAIAPEAVRRSPQLALADANAVIFRPGCPEWPASEPLLVQAGFRFRFQGGEFQLWVRSKQPGQ
jgi:hypothetical protein